LGVEALEERWVLGQFSPWGPPINLGPVVNSAANDQHPAISPDGLSLYITSNRPGGHGSFDLWVSQRATKEDDWGPPVNLGNVINGAGRDFSPVFSPDGHWMIYARAPGEDENGDDLYITHRADKYDDFAWETPVRLGPNVNVPGYGDSGPALFEDPATGLLNLYFTSNRPGGKGDWDIYRSVRQEDGTFSPAELVREVSSPYRDVRTTIRGDGLEMILTATNPAYLPAPNPQAALDLWVSTRPTTQDAWSTPVNLGLTVNSPSPTAADSAPDLSRDGKTLLFYSNRTDLGGLGGNDLYMTTRTELDGEDGGERLTFAAGVSRKAPGEQEEPAPKTRTEQEVGRKAGGVQAEFPRRAGKDQQDLAGVWSPPGFARALGLTPRPDTTPREPATGAGAAKAGESSQPAPTALPPVLLSGGDIIARSVRSSHAAADSPFADLASGLPAGGLVAPLAPRGLCVRPGGRG
jgi:hypothetical protein